MSKPTNFSDLIYTWGIQRLADDLGIKYVTVTAMRRRGSIAVRYWPELLVHAPQRGFSLNADDLVAMAAAGKASA